MFIPGSTYSREWIRRVTYRTSRACRRKRAAFSHSGCVLHTGHDALWPMTRTRILTISRLSAPFRAIHTPRSEAAAPPSAKWSRPCGADELRASRSLWFGHQQPSRRRPFSRRGAFPWLRRVVHLQAQRIRAISRGVSRGSERALGRCAFPCPRAMSTCSPWHPLTPAVASLSLVSQGYSTSVPSVLRE